MKTYSEFVESANEFILTENAWVDKALKWVGRAADVETATHPETNWVEKGLAVASFIRPNNPYLFAASLAVNPTLQKTVQKNIKKAVEFRRKNPLPTSGLMPGFPGRR